MTKVLVETFNKGPKSADETITIKPHIIDLQSGVVYGNQRANSGEVQVYRLRVPADHNVRCATVGDNGDADLYLQFHHVPFTTLEFFLHGWDCSSVNWDSNEICTTDSPGQVSSILYVGLLAMRSYTGVSISCTIRSNSDSKVSSKSRQPTPFQNELILELVAGVEFENQKAQRDEVQIYALSAPARSYFHCSSSADNGDADLYLRFDDFPEISWNSTDNDCSSNDDFSDEECTALLAGTTDTVLYVALHAYEPYHSLSIICSVGTLPVIKDEIIELESNFQLMNQNGRQNEIQLYKLLVPANHQVRCIISGGNGDADLYLRWNDIPDLYLGDYDCKSDNVDNNDECSIGAYFSRPSDEIVYVALHAFESYHGVTIVCTVEE